MPGTLRLKREAFGIELRRGRFEIVLDGATVGGIEHGETIELPFDPGRHALRIRRGRYSSPSRTFDGADGGLITFRCHGATLWPLYVASIIKPDLAISLHRE